jgi:hypothetical protein
VPASAESWFAAGAFRLAAEAGVRGVIAHSDPRSRERRTPTGVEQIHSGHWGTIYQASGMAYLGRTRPRRLTVLPDGSVLADRVISKVRADESGHGGAERRLIALGARPREAREPGHMVHWLRLPEFADVPLSISRNRLIRYKSLPRAVGRWVMDSGGFTMLQQYGRSPMTAAEYVAEVRRIVDGVGRMPDWVAPMDNMCESQVIYGRRDVPRSSPQWFHGTRELRGLKPGDPEQDLATAVRIHQRLTVDNYLQPLELAPEIPWMPVLQGATLASYIDCADRYAAAGVDLGAEPIVGLGSVCRRQATGEIGAIVSTFADRGWLLHGFGVPSPR